VSGLLTDVIRRNLAHDPGDAPAVDLTQDLLDDFSWVDAAAGPAWSPPEPPPMRTRDLIHPA
jgi:hypothetical protein